jgi:hypothetical protein
VPQPQDLRPLELGELIDRTITFWRAHLKPLFALGLGFELVLYAFAKVLSLGLLRVSAGAPAEMELPSLLALCAGMVVLMVLMMWTYLGGAVAASAYVVPALLQREATPGAALQRMFARFGAITSALVVCGLGMAVFLVVFVVPITLLAALSSQLKTLGIVGAILLGLLWSLASLALLLWAWLRLAVTGPVLAYEDLGGVGSLLRSSRLVSGRLGPGFLGRVIVRASIVFAVAFLILLAVQIVSSLPTLIAAGIYGIGQGTLKAPQTVMVPIELIQVVAKGLFGPIAWVLASVFYLDLRVRKEGLDLELELAPEPA